MIVGIINSIFEFLKPFFIAFVVSTAVYMYFFAQQLPGQMAVLEKVNAICANQPSLCVAAPKEQPKPDAQ